METHFVLCHNKHRMRGSCPPLHFKFKGFTHDGIFTVRCALDLTSRHRRQAVCHEKMRYAGSTMTANIGKKLYAFYVTDKRNKRTLITTPRFLAGHCYFKKQNFTNRIDF